MSRVQRGLHWKSFYAAADFYSWQHVKKDGRSVYYRRLGIVENMFDTDGIDFEGRADLNMQSTTELKTKLTDEELQRRILLAWSCLRGLHPLLACKSLYGEEFLPGESGRLWIDKYFVYEKPSDPQQLIQSARQHITFVQEAYPDAEIEDFYRHLMNTGRVFDEKQTMSRLFVMPFQRTTSDTFKLSMVIVAGHSVADGLTVFRLNVSFIDLLNVTEQDLLKCIALVCSEKGDPSIVMAPPQESLYPVYTENAARDKWNWAITLVLRHVHKPPPASFQNPLRRNAPLMTAARMPEKYPRVLNYAKIPPLNGFPLEADLSQRATNNLIKLCRQAGISVGSGAFTLVGIVMMRFEEALHPDVPYWERLPFVGSFPLNPRPFLSGTPTTGREDSLMLAFSWGITLPFIPSDMDFRKTFRVLGRLAHRQLRQYQKRKRTPAEEVHLGSRSPRELLPALYLMTMERADSKVKPEQRVGFNPQGAYPARSSATMATCGISSVGDRSALVNPRRYSSNPNATDLIADFADLRSAVRPRDGEFLVGAIGTKESMQFRVSYDGSNIDPEKAEAWKKAIVSILDFDLDTESAASPDIASISGRQSKL